MLGSILGSPYLGNYHMVCREPLTQKIRCKLRKASCKLLLPEPSQPQQVRVAMVAGLDGEAPQASQDLEPWF